MTSAPTVAAVLAAGSAGAVARYVVDAGITRRARHPLPWGTLWVNVLGSLVLGVVTGLSLHHGAPEALRLVVGVGFCGGFTTFSTFALEVTDLHARGADRPALLAVVLNVGGALLAAQAGLVVAS